LLPVKPGKRYLLSFDYQSPNAESAGYYIGFNNDDATSVSERLPVQGEDWQSYTKVIEVPAGASTGSLAVYSYSKDEKTNIITRYDNFSFIELPPIHNRYFLVSEPTQQLVKPAAINFELNSPTKKTVNIQGASTSFYLTMSEAYHPQWRLMMNDAAVTGGLRGWTPWAKPNAVGENDHFKLDEFLNGWYVNIEELCKTRGLCHRNFDGTYDLAMQIEFWPQRWFYVGLVVSGTTLAACLGYLGWYAVRYLVSRRHKSKRKSPDVHRGLIVE
jgi:hypothetical protein